MPDHRDELDHAIRRVIGRAGSDAPDASAVRAGTHASAAAFAGNGAGRRRWLLPATLGFAAAAVVGLVVMVNLRDDPVTPAEPAPTATPTATTVAPTTPPPTNPTTTQPTTPATTLPATTVPAADSPACTAADLSAHIASSDGAMGTQYVPVVFRNVGDHTCRLIGAPSLELLDVDGSPVTAEVTVDPTTPPPNGALADDVVRTGDDAAAVATWTMMCEAYQGGASGLQPATFRIVLPDGSHIDLANDIGLDATCGVTIGPFGASVPDWAA